MPHPTRFLAALLLTAALTAGCSTPESPIGPPNVVILFADDMGYGDVGVYGHPLIRTPHIDELAAEGLRFTSFYAGAPLCTASRAALLTGRHGLRVGLPNVLMPESATGLASGETTIAEEMKALGYRTMAVGKWHVGHAEAEFRPLAQGFDAWFGLPYSNDMIRPWVQTDVPLRFWRDDMPLDDPPVVQSELTVRYTSEAVRFIEESSDAPFFLYVAYSMPHLPIAAPDSVRGRSRAGRYGDVIETLDWSVGRIRSALERTGAIDRTLLVFTSDNGPWLGLPDRMLQDGVVRWDAGSPGLLRGWKGTTYEGGLRVPAIVRWPGIVRPGEVTAEPASVLDLLPTVVAAAGGTIDGDRLLDGMDLRPVLEGTGTLGERPFFYLNGRRVEGVRVGAWKLRVSNQLRPVEEQTDPPTPELYNLDLDPSERYDRSAEYPDRVRALHELIRSAAAEMDGQAY